MFTLIVREVIVHHDTPIVSICFFKMWEQESTTNDAETNDAPRREEGERSSHILKKQMDATGVS